MTPRLQGLVLVFGLAAAVAVALAALMKVVAPRVGAVARPSADRWHRRTVPLLGGVAVAGSVVLTVAAAGGLTRSLLPLVVTSGLLFALGLLDDFRNLKPSAKLTGQIAAACIAVILGARGGWASSPGLDSLLTILWIVGITNALNLLDNMDGLCAGVAAIAALASAAHAQAGTPNALYAAAVAGACAGFLVFNFNPASIFLGDSGSLFLGASLATLSVVGEEHAGRDVFSTIAVPVSLLLLPIFDTTFVTLSRKLSRRSASVGGRDHTSHRLVAMGFSERQAVLILWSLAALGGATALVLARTRLAEANVALGVLLLAVLLFGVHLAKVRVYGEQDFAALRDRPFTPLLVDFTYRRRIFEVLLDLALASMAYYAAYVIRFDTEFPAHYDYFARSLPIVIACQIGSFLVVGVYRGVWRYFTAADLTTYIKGVLLGAITSIISLVYMHRFEGYSRGVFMIDAMALGLLVAGSRVSFRVLGEWASRHRTAGQRALVYGAGDGGALVVRELRNNAHYGYDPIGFIDDDSRKQGKRIMGLRVIGRVEDLPAIIAEHRADLVIVSTRKLTDPALRTLRATCYESGTTLLQLDFRLDSLLPDQPRSRPSRD